VRYKNILSHVNVELIGGRPLRSATCQSVRMTFLALVPGIHTIGALILTDTETQHSLTLRYGITFSQTCQSFIDLIDLPLELPWMLLYMRCNP
jgi:hypothetical protein